MTSFCQIKAFFLVKRRGRSRQNYI